MLYLERAAMRAFRDIGAVNTHGHRLNKKWRKSQSPSHTAIATAKAVFGAATTGATS